MDVRHLTPQEHYEEAERLIAVGVEREKRSKVAMHVWAQAQVHATLATFQPQISVEVSNPGDFR